MKIFKSVRHWWTPAAVAVLLLAGLVAIPAYGKKKKKKEPRIMTTIQLQRAVETLKNTNWWMLNGGIVWAKSDEAVDGYISELPDFGQDAIAETRRLLDRQHERCAEILNVRHDILLDADGSPSEEQELALLAKYFGDKTDDVQKCFTAASAFETRYARLIPAMEAELSGRQPQTVLSGHLRRLRYTISNGFAGYRSELTFARQADGTGRLTEAVSRRDADDTSKTITVADSVVEHVEQSILLYRAYEIGRRYRPDHDIPDASSWELTVTFDGGEFSSQGHASGPAREYHLDELLNYLSRLIE